MRKIVLLVLVSLVLVGCASKEHLANTCEDHIKLFIEGENPTFEEVNSILGYCQHAIDANLGKTDLIELYNTTFLRFYNPDGTPK